MSSESQRRFWCNFCCTSNTNAAECFAITHLIILGIAECFMFYGIGSTGISNISWHTTAFWPMLGFFTYWFILSILVVIGTNGHQNHGLLLVSTVLGMVGNTWLRSLPLPILLCLLRIQQLSTTL